MQLLALAALPLLTIAAALILTALAPPAARLSYFAPAVGTVALATLAAILVTALWSHR
ncbi:hypothetical protein [Streptomyces sp. A1136]|uniref:hypothetical protein n=1 Tax=Streptomyces sp. A1136 TaxID=2563102 RepID=UPI001444A0C1|nr:hypothetical protein [Streptomyces sp. A1136]